MDPRMVIIFWICGLGLLWTYIGYPAVMLVRGRGRCWPRNAPRGNEFPDVSIVLAVRNAVREVPSRVRNLLEQKYPSGRVEVVVVCNGCTDGSEQAAGELAEADPRVRALTSPADQGKAGALNAGVAASRGAIVVFADVRQVFDAQAVRRLVRRFRECGTGAVTGRLVMREDEGAAPAGVGSYWKWETRLRLAESRTGSVMGATGAIYAVRRDLFTPLPAGLILDDVYAPLTIAKRGYRIGMAPGAIAYDRPSSDNVREYRRRVRTLVGNVELLRLMPDLLIPGRTGLFFRFVSHKVLRLLTPLFGVGLLVSGVAVGGLLYNAVAGVLLLTYLLGLVGFVVPWRLFALPSAFLLLHVAGAAALLRPNRRAADVWVS